MQLYDSSICCRSLVEAFRRVPDAELDSNFFVGFDEGGAPFYKLGSLHGGQLVSAFTEPLVFCPFCGTRILAASESPRALEQTLIFDEEETVVAPRPSQEIETLVSALNAHDPGALTVAAEA